MSTKFQTTFNPYTVNSSKTVIFADFHIKTVIFPDKTLTFGTFLAKTVTRQPIKYSIFERIL